jgi:hypothetical protein
MSETQPTPATLATDVSHALKELHRALIRSEIGEDQALQNPYTMLFALIGDPRFAWMGPLSQLIARIDQQVADDEIADEAALLGLHREISDLTIQGKGEDLATFRMRHVMALQKEPEVGMATGRLRKALSVLPPLPEDKAPKPE